LDKADFPDARALYCELAGQFPVGDDCDFARLVDHPGTTIWGVDLQGRVASMVTLHLLPNMSFSARPYALIENVVTLSRFQGQGLGRIAMNAAMDHAWSAGAYKIMLMTGRGAQARGFYEKLGFEGESKHAMMIRRAPSRTG